jgi:curved DNA-binding protein CbpA
MTRNFYEILGVRVDATIEELKAAYYAKARELHPDTVRTPEEKARRGEALAMISTAYNILKDAQQRAAYDRKMRLSPSDSPAPTAASPPPTPSSAAGPPAPPPAQAPSRPPDPQRRPASQPTETAAMDLSRVSTANRAYKRGMEFLKASDHDRAIECFELAIKNVDSEPQYHAQLASTLLLMHRGFGRATEAAEKAISLDPYNMDHRILLAEICRTAGVKSRVAQVCNDILRWDPTNEHALALLRTVAPATRGKFALMRFLGPFGRIFGKR